jgi:hypothetical protein
MTQRKQINNVPFMDLTNTAPSSSQSSQTSSQGSKKRGPNKNWIKIREYDNEEEVKSIMNSPDWASAYKGHTNDGKYFVYRCAHSCQKLSEKRAKEKASKQAAKRRKLAEEVELDDDFFEDKEEEEMDPCPVSIKFVYRPESTIVDYYETDDEHRGHTKSTRVGFRVKQLIEELYNRGVTKPSSIMIQLRTEDLHGEQLPTRIQLYYQVQKIKLEKYGSVNLSLGDLNNWLKKFSSVPDDDDTPFVVKHESGSKTKFAPMSDLFDEDDDYDDDEFEEEDEAKPSLYFRLFVTSKKLLKSALLADHVCADATYKLIWLGFPVLIIGNFCTNY